MANIGRFFDCKFMARKWNTEEVDFLLKNYKKLGGDACARHLNISPAYLVYYKAECLSLGKKVRKFQIPADCKVKILISWDEFNTLKNHDKIPFECDYCGNPGYKIKQNIKRAIFDSYSFVCCSIQCQGKMRSKQFIENAPSKSDIECLINKDLMINEIGEHFHVGPGTVRKWLRHYNLITKTNARVYGVHPKIKEKKSIQMKKYLLGNPNHIFWRIGKTNKSVPCEKLKENLRKKGIKFTEEQKILLHLGHLYSADIVFEDLGVIIEVNGKQHYSNWGDRILAPRYQKRHDLLISNGWKVFEIPCHLVTTKDFWDNTFPEILKSRGYPSFEYKKFLSTRGKRYVCQNKCGNRTPNESKICDECKLLK